MRFRDDFFNDFFAPILSDNSVAVDRVKRPFDLHKGLMRTDVRETEKEFIVDVNLPGYKKDDIKIELKDDYLIISAEKVEEKEEKGEDGKFLYKQRYSGACKRSVYVGDKNIKEDEIKASFTDGVLTMNIPKGEEVKEEKKLIAID